ncbi:enoyl-CoA hydratase/isomerase family protein [Mesorhizobium sp. 1B3]|uniref:enoyl-CoA hydratase/isomerase family protein n=1 Tax=Mesorhizobium sp. 1B3 TaxID=3243599 RepID=UPI003D99FA0B
MSIETTIGEGIARVVINRPEKRNAVDVETHEALRALWPRLESDPGVRVIILTGSGRDAFCAGADIRSFLPYLRERIAAGEDPGDFCGLTHRALAKPVVAAINGASFGGGLELALAADIRIAADHATFGLPEVRIGAIAGAGGVTRLPRAIPTAVARDMILTGRPISAARAHQLGLVSEIVPFEALHATADDIARLVARNSPKAIALSREVMDRTDGLALDKALDIEREAFRRSTKSEDFGIGIASFTAGEKPEFSGR